MREYALSIGKTNFFTFGEVWQENDEKRIAEFVGRDSASVGDDLVGVDAALDFPIWRRLREVARGFQPPRHSPSTTSRDVSSSERSSAATATPAVIL